MIYMDATQAQRISNNPGLFECNCHLREDTSSIIVNENNRSVELSAGIRDLSAALKSIMIDHGVKEDATAMR